MLGSHLRFQGGFSLRNASFPLKFILPVHMEEEGSAIHPVPSSPEHSDSSSSTSGVFFLLAVMMNLLFAEMFPER